MADDDKVSAFRLLQFWAGVVLFAGMILLHVFVKELPVYLMAIPGILMGVDPSKFIGGGKK